MEIKYDGESKSGSVDIAGVLSESAVRFVSNLDGYLVAFRCSSVEMVGIGILDARKGTNEPGWR